VAEGFCLQQFGRDDLSAARRVELTLELSRTFVEHAKNVQGEERADLWKRAVQVIDDATPIAQGEEDRARLAFQRALVPAEQGEFLLWEVDFSPHDSDLRREATAALDAAVQAFEKIEGPGEKRPRPAANQAGTNASSQVGIETNSLHLDAKLYLAAALLDRVRLRDGGDAGITADLTRAEDILKPLVSSSPRETRVRARVLLARLARMRGNVAEAHRQLDAAVGDAPEGELYDGLVAQQVLLLLDEKSPADAADVLVVYRRSRGILSNRLAALKVQTTLAMLKVAEANKETELAAGLREHAEKHVAVAEREAGGYWAQRSKLLLERAKDDHEIGDELAAIVRTAKGLHADGKIEPAVDAYGRAVATAERNGNEKLAMELGITRASLQFQAGRVAEATDEFRQLADRHPQEANAPTAHLMWAYGLGRLYDAEKSETRLENYSDALETHLAKFGSDETAGDARWMLARVEEGRRNFSRALELYREVPAGHERSANSQAAVARCYELLIDELRKSNQPTSPAEEAAAKQLETFVAAFPPLPQGLSESQQEVALRLARIRLNQIPPSYEAADVLLERTLSGPDETPKGENPANENGEESLLTAARRLRMISLAGRGRFDDANGLVASFSRDGVADVLSIVHGLSRLSVPSNSTTKPQLGRLQLRLTQLLNERRNTMSQPEQERFDFYRAQAYVFVGQTDVAVELYDMQLAKSPRDKRLLVSAARSLGSFDAKPCLEKSKTYWRRAESLEHPGSGEWLVARYHVVRCCLKLKQIEECASLLRATRLLYPEMGGPELKARFDELESQLAQSKS
jgi:tetratricopeptide (TPR) repeat protein